MKFWKAFLGGSVARQILLLFVLSALIPVVAIVVLSISQVSQALVRQSQTQLTQAAKDFGASVLGRLLLLDQHVQTLAHHPLPASATNPDIQNKIATVAVFDSTDRPAHLLNNIGFVPALTDN